MSVDLFFEASARWRSLLPETITVRGVTLTLVGPDDPNWSTPGGWGLYAYRNDTVRSREPRGLYVTVIAPDITLVTAEFARHIVNEARIIVDDLLEQEGIGVS